MGHPIPQSERTPRQPDGVTIDRELPEPEGWLARRAAATDWLTVELGHGCTPLSLSEEFSGGRAYIGVEAWHDPRDQEDLAVFRELMEKPSSNVLFIDYQDGFDADEYLLRRHRPEWYPPEWLHYETVLPAGIADEVIIRNVAGDPETLHTGGITGLLAEARRLISPVGRVVIFEDYTPWELDEDQVEQTGLTVSGLYRCEGGHFEKLARIYSHRLRNTGSGDSYIALLQPIGPEVDSGEASDD